MAILSTCAKDCETNLRLVRSWHITRYGTMKKDIKKTFSDKYNIIIDPNLKTKYYLNKQILYAVFVPLQNENLLI